MRSMAESNLAVRPGDHPVHGTWLSVDVVALTDDPEPKIVLIERAGAPHKGETTLPGGLLAAWDGETVEQCARRIMRDKAGTELTGGARAGRGRGRESPQADIEQADRYQRQRPDIERCQRQGSDGAGPHGQQVTGPAG